MRNPDVKIIISTKCELLVSPKTELADAGFVYLEFLVSDSIDTLSTLVISEDPSLFRYYFNEDGLYMYYRLKVPTKTKLEGESLEGRLYFDNTTNKLMIGIKEVTKSSELEDVIDDDAPHTTYGISSDIVEEPVFSICRISACLENLQRKYIFEGHPDLTGSRCKEDSDKNIRDFLFSSIFILRLLIRQQRYEEALRILESINNCGTICDSTYTSRSSCGCNR
jgi:hypothetical protein